MCVFFCSFGMLRQRLDIKHFRAKNLVIYGVNPPISQNIGAVRRKLKKIHSSIFCAYKFVVWLNTNLNVSIDFFAVHLTIPIPSHNAVGAINRSTKKIIKWRYYNHEFGFFLLQWLSSAHHQQKKSKAHFRNHHKQKCSKKITKDESHHNYKHISRR